MQNTKGFNNFAEHLYFPLVLTVRCITQFWKVCFIVMRMLKCCVLVFLQIQDFSQFFKFSFTKGSTQNIPPYLTLLHNNTTLRYVVWDHCVFKYIHILLQLWIIHCFFIFLANEIKLYHIVLLYSSIHKKCMYVYVHTHVTYPCVHTWYVC